MEPRSHGACAACKYQRRKCAADCPLAPWFPPDQPKRFANVHRLFGVSNVLKLFKQSAGRLRDLVQCILYEAYARERDPVNGAYGILQLLQREANILEAEKAKLQETLDKMLETETQKTEKHYLVSTMPQQLLNQSESWHFSPYFPAGEVYWHTQQQIGIASEQTFVQYHQQNSGYPQLLQAQCALEENGFSYQSVNACGLQEAMPQSNRERETMMVPLKNVNSEHQQSMRIHDFLSLGNNNHIY